MIERFLNHLRLIRLSLILILIINAFAVIVLIFSGIFPPVLFYLVQFGVSVLALVPNFMMHLQYSRYNSGLSLMFVGDVMSVSRNGREVAEIDLEISWVEKFVCNTNALQYAPYNYYVVHWSESVLYITSLNQKSRCLDKYVNEICVKPFAFID